VTRGPAGPLFVTRTGARWRPDNAAQCDALTAAECDRVFIDHGASGKLARRPELDAALGTSKPLAPSASEPKHRSVSGVERTAVRSGTRRRLLVTPLRRSADFSICKSNLTSSRHTHPGGR
jgi:hypothetical protein